MLMHRRTSNFPAESVANLMGLLYSVFRPYCLAILIISESSEDKIISPFISLTRRKAKIIVYAIKGLPLTD